MRKVSLSTIWKSERGKGRYIPSSSHDYYELVYYCDGTGVTKVGEEVYDFTPNTFMLIPYSVIHDELHNTGCTVFVVGFHCDTKIPQVFGDDAQKVILRIISSLYREATDQQMDYQYMIEANLNELVIEILRTKHSKNTDVKNFEYIINHLTDNYHERISLSDCAAQLNISYDYFQHKFKEITGYSPQNYLINLRLKASKELLLNHKLSCTEISYRCGFSTSAQFSMLFKREYGVSPQSFRREFVKK